jgi:hypothetical protein
MAERFPAFWRSWSHSNAVPRRRRDGEIGPVMTNHPDRADNGADAPAETPARRTRGVDPLSGAHRKRILAALNRAAVAGDVAAQQALIELSMAAERDKAIAATLEQAKGEGEAGT